MTCFKRALLPALIASCFSTEVTAQTPQEAAFEAGQSYGNSQKNRAKDEGFFQQDKATSKIKEVRPDYTDNPQEVSTYATKPPRAQGDERIAFCRDTDPKEMDAATKQECSAINFLVENANKQNPYSIDKQSDPMMVRFRQAQDAALAGKLESSCQYTTNTPTTAGGKTEYCSEGLGSKIHTCQEISNFKAAPRQSAASEGTFSYLMNYGFMTSSTYRSYARSDFLDRSPPVDVTFSYNLREKSAGILKREIKVPWSGGVGAVLFASPMPAGYPAYSGTSSDPVRRIFESSFSPPITAIMGTLKESVLPDESDEIYRLAMLSNGNDRYHGNVTFNGQKLFPVLPEPCTATKCFGREVVGASPSLDESPTLLGFGDYEAGEFFYGPSFNPERNLFFTGVGGIRAEGSRYAQPLAVKGDVVDVPFYAGISSANAYYDVSTKQVIAFTVGKIERGQELVGRLVDARTSSVVCEVNFGRINYTSSMLADYQGHISFDDRLGTDWATKECTSSAAQSLISRVRNLGEYKQVTQAIQGDVAYFAATVKGHMTMKDTTYTYCPTYIRPDSSLWNSTLVGQTNEVTLQLRQDQLTQNCTGGRIAEEQIPSKSHPNYESYPFYLGLATAGGIAEEMVGDCEQFKRRAQP